MERPGDEKMALALRLVAEWCATPLKSYDRDVRNSAVDVLNKLGKHAAPAARSLAIQIEDSDPYVRKSAVHALGLIGRSLRSK